MVSKSFIAYACLLYLTTSINAQSVTSDAKAKSGHAHKHKHEGHSNHHTTQHHARDAVSDAIDGRNFELPNSHVGIEDFPVHVTAPGVPHPVELRDLEALADRSHGHHRKHKSHSTSSTSRPHVGRGLESFAEQELGNGEKFVGGELHNLLRRLETHLPHHHKHKSHSSSSTSHAHVERGLGSFIQKAFKAVKSRSKVRSPEVHRPHHHKHKSSSSSSTSRPHVERDLQDVVNEVNKLGSGEKFVGSHLFVRSPEVHRPHHHKHKSSSSSSTSRPHVERDLQAVVNEVNKLGSGEKFVGSHLFARSPEVHRPHHHKHKSSSASSTSHAHIGRGLESVADGEELHNLLRRLEVPFGHGQPFPVYTPGEIHAVGFRRRANSRNCKFFWPALII